VRSPTGVALQGTPALFSSHRVLGFFAAACEEREREEQCSQNDTISFFFFLFYLWGTHKWVTTSIL
jgi:hypothetical protein